MTMTLTDEQRIDRLRKRLTELELWTVRSTVPLDDWTFNGKPLSLGSPWPTRDGVAVIAHGEVSVPADWPLDQARLDIDLGGEGLVTIAYAGGDSEGFGLDPNHQRFPLKAGRFSVTADCVARLPFGVPNRDARLKRAQIAWIEMELAEFVLLLRQVAEAAAVLRQHEVVQPLLSAAEDGAGRARLADRDGKLRRPGRPWRGDAEGVAAAGGARRSAAGPRRGSADVRDDRDGHR